MIAFVVLEKEQGIKHQHLVSGVHLYAYWTSNLLWDFVKHLLPTIFCSAFIFIFKVNDLKTPFETLAAVILLFLLYGPAAAAFSYLFAFCFSDHTQAMLISFFLHLSGGIVMTPLCLILRSI